MNRKGFTLLELIIVIIILGVLATLGFTQYGVMVEKSRGAEARAICGDIRKAAGAHFMQFGALNLVAPDDFNIARANIGVGNNQIPSVCRASHYFSYGIGIAANTVTITATRCIAGGKVPQAAVANTLVLTSNVQTGADSWTSAFGY